MTVNASKNPLQSLDQWEDFVANRYPQPGEKGKDDYRNYDNPGRDSVREFYRLNHRHQTYAFVLEKKRKYLALEQREMTVLEAMDFLNTLVDDSDPDTDLSQKEHLLIICPSYEGVDDRVCEVLVDDELSIGDYVLTNGGLPAMIIIDAITRLLPGALGDDESARDESFSHGLLEYPHYTRPAEFRGMKVPDVLLSGHHAEIVKWRAEQSRQRTAERRPDLLNTSGADSEPQQTKKL